jgi:putative ABC transport system ATP-binding protein
VESDLSASTVLATRGVVLARGGRIFAALPDLAVPRGRSVAILGASGSGKTTALMALAGIRAPASGEIVVEDTALWGLSVSVATNLALAARCAGLPPDSGRMNQLLETLQIAELRRRRADRISHGQAQRVAIARALFNKPAVVFADEPTSALDDASTARLLALLREAAAIEGAGLVIATHDRRIVDSVDETIELRSVQ